MRRSLEDFGLRTPWNEVNNVGDNIPPENHFESLSDRQAFIVSLIRLLSPHLMLVNPTNCKESDNPANSCLEAEERYNHTPFFGFFF